MADRKLTAMSGGVRSRAKKRRRPNPRLAKIHRSYTVAEIAELFGVHRHTVRRWIKDGLSTVAGVRPFLVLGRDLRDFLQSRRDTAKRRCKPGELYCCRCRKPRRAAEGMADFRPGVGGVGMLSGLCPVCECMMYRSASEARLAAAIGDLDVTFTTAEPRIVDSDPRAPDADLSKE